MRSRTLIISIVAALVIFIAVPALVLWRGARSHPAPLGTDQYASDAYGFSFAYPSEYVLREFAPEYIGIGRRPARGTGIESLADVALVAAEPGSYGSYDEFLKSAIQAMCGSDNPNLTMSCAAPERRPDMETATGLSGETYYVSQEMRVGTATAITAERGPFHVFAVSANVPRSQYAALIIHPPLDRPQAREMADLVQVIAQTLKIGKVEMRQATSSGI